MRKLYLLVLSLFILMSVSCVFASDNATVADAHHAADTSVANVTVPSTFDADSSANSNVNVAVPSTDDVNNVSEPGSYDDLNNDIQKINSGDTYDFTKDYKFNGKGQTIILQNRVIEIKQNNIILNGNGHTIDAGGLENFAIFKVLGNNVTIKDLKFINSNPASLTGPTIFDYCKYQKVLSPITWMGDNGVMEGCLFGNDTSVNGGAVAWMGDNGRISSCLFINNTARGAGGALYIGGTNNTVSNCRFINSSSQLSGEAVYIDRNRKNIQFTNDSFINAYPIIDGSVFNIDVNYLYYSRFVDVYGNLTTSEAYRVDIIPLIYRAIMKGGMNDINDVLKYYVQYDNKTGYFALNIAGHDDVSSQIIHLNMDYLKSYCFANITDFNQVFEAVIHGNYKYDITQVVTAYVTCDYDYMSLRNVEAFGLWFNTDKGVRTLSNGLKIIFTAPITVNNGGTWDLKKMGYNTVIFEGNGATIKGGAGDRDEKKWVVLDDKGVTFIANNLTISNFNTAVECLQGTCYFNDMTFKGNRMDYWIDRDWGAAILNTGIVICNNCTFTDNYAKYGGAIFNQGFLSLDNCTFKGNTAYGKKDDVHVGDNVCIGDGGVIQIDGKNVTSNNKIAYFAKSISKSTATWMTVVSVVGSFAIGFIAGVITANPIAGVAIGIAVGAAIGTFTAAEIISSNYDINYDRLTTCLFVIGGSALAGAAGGFVGYLASGASAASTSAASQADDNMMVQTVYDNFE